MWIDTEQLTRRTSGILSRPRVSQDMGCSGSQPKIANPVPASPVHSTLLESPGRSSGSKVAAKATKVPVPWNWPGESENLTIFTESLAEWYSARPEALEL